MEAYSSIGFRILINEKTKVDFKRATINSLSKLIA